MNVQFLIELAIWATILHSRHLQNKYGKFELSNGWLE